jgi:Ca2+-transporting ATPase
MGLYPSNGKQSGGGVNTPDATKRFSEPRRSELQGLSEAEAAVRLKNEGFNELPSARPRKIWATAFEILREPMLLLLLAAGLLYLFLGDLREAAVLLVAIFMVIGITLYQEHKAERALEALRDLSSPRALVIRDGAQRRIAGREVVRGELVLLSEGDRVPADAVVLSSVNLTVDESLLTGESVPVRKAASEQIPETMGRPGGDDLPFVYSATLVVQGRGIARVLATGSRTELGRIGKALEMPHAEKTPLQRQTSRLVRIFATFALSLCVVAVIAYGLSRQDWPKAILVGLTMAMSMVPEEMPVVLTILLAVGAWRISKRGVLTRRIPAVETLGAATVLCVDKTGTLTENQMSVSALFAGANFLTVAREQTPPLGENFRKLIATSVLASQRDPFDPMEKALLHLAEKSLPKQANLDSAVLVREYPLSPQLLAVTRVWATAGSDTLRVATKGAPEAIAQLCKLSKSDAQALYQQATEMAGRGLRVLGVAEAVWPSRETPHFPSEFDFEFLGLIGLADPVRRTVPVAIRECQTAGIRVVMITGDYAATGQNIARQIGLANPEQSLSGSELDAMDDRMLRESVKVCNLFVRTVPEHKLRLVKALQANDEVVAMTGDGVNDAPALRAADIGVAMGGRGTDVARESASLVLLEDDFSSLVSSVRLGRRIYDNLRKALSYVFAIHVPIAGMSLVPVLFKWPLVLLPLHIVFLEFIIDPACSTAFEAEPEETDVMQRPPRDPKQPLFNRKNIVLSLLQGAGTLAAVLVVYIIALKRGQGESDARALAFTTLVVANLGLIWINRSQSRTVVETLRSPNRALWWITSGALGFLALVLYVSFLRDLFQFSYLHPADLVICFGAAALSLLWFDLLKIYRRLGYHPSSHTR